MWSSGSAGSRQASTPTCPVPKNLPPQTPAHRLHQGSLAKKGNVLIYRPTIYPLGPTLSPPIGPNALLPTNPTVLMDSPAYRIISTRLGSYRNATHTCTYKDTKRDNQCKMLSGIEQTLRTDPGQLCWGSNWPRPQHFQGSTGIYQAPDNIQ